MRLRTGVRLGIVLSLASAFIAYSVFLYNLGTGEEANQIAVSLQSPFDLSVGPGVKWRGDNMTTQSLNEIFFRYPLDYPQQEDGVVLQLVQVDDNANSNPIGKAKVHKPPRVRNSVLEFLGNALGILNFISSAGAQEAFDWRGHQQRRDFYEKYVAPNTIWRYYGDGSILEYRVDDKGVMVSSTFRWVR